MGPPLCAPQARPLWSDCRGGFYLALPAIGRRPKPGKGKEGGNEMKKVLLLVTLVAMMAVVGCNKNKTTESVATTESAVATEAAVTEEAVVATETAVTTESATTAAATSEAAAQ